jgi:ATP-dependent DNA helicase RecG
MALPVNVSELLHGRVVESERLQKVQKQAEALRYFNYPYEAIDEILVNAVYHRSYEEREPVEVRIYPDEIVVFSYPGTLPPLGKDNINKPIVTPHRYRNSRLGDALKELQLTEGRCTGFPKIRRALKLNGSPPPVFQTDNDREYFKATLKIHPKTKSEFLKELPPADQKNEGLNEGLKTLWKAIKKRPGIQVKDLTNVLNGRPIKTIERQLMTLIKMKIVERKGSRKTGGYYVI